MFKKSFVLISTAALLSATYGCSSSKNNTSSDSGVETTGDSGVSTNPIDGGTTSTADGSSSNKDSGTTGSSDSGSTGSSDAASASTCPAVVTDADIPAYVTPAVNLTACTAAQVSSFDTDCFGSSASSSTCSGWASANATCAACVENPSGAGPVNPTAGTVNVGGCVQLANPEDAGVTCGAPIGALLDCLGAACGGCSSSANSACQTAAQGSGGACYSYFGALPTACANATVFAAVSACQASTAAFVTPFCGGAGDAGSISDAATGG